MLNEKQKPFATHNPIFITRSNLSQAFQRMRQNSATNGMVVELRLKWGIFTWMRLVMKIGLSAINIPYTVCVT